MKPETVAVEFDEAVFDPDAVKIIRRLRRYGHEAFFVGGCVRDLLLGEKPKDFDVATAAKPDEIRKLFRNCRIIGRRFRLAHIFFPGNKIIEVATFRSQAPAVDSSEKDLLIVQDNVFGTAETDALRRDFTLNALFYDVEQKAVIDYVGGLHDLRERKIVSIGDAWVRLREDPVRIIRAVKFSAKLNLQLAPDLARAVVDCHEEIQKSSPARVIEEIFKILLGKGSAETFDHLYQMGLLKYIFPFLVEDYEKSSDQKNYWNFLKALDLGLCQVEIERGVVAPVPLQNPTRAIRFAALVAPLFLKELLALGEERVGQDVRHTIADRVRDLGISIRNPRKDTYQAQHIFMAQERLWRGAYPDFGDPAGSPHRRLKKKLSPKLLASRIFFSEARQFMWLCGAAHPAMARWQAYQSWAPWSQPGAGYEGAQTEYPPQNFRKRRRRRRRHRSPE